MVIGESATGGLIPQREHQILLNVFDFAEREAHQLMTPRTRMVTFPVDIGEADLARQLAASRHTRFPIHDGDLDHIIGTLHLKDFIRWQLAPDGPLDLRRLARPARMVPEHIPAKDLMEVFRRERGHMAIVIDEYGGTAGLVTLEDVAEELVGELRDEFDVEAPAVEILAANVLQVRGDMLLADLADYTALPAELPDVDTVAGLLVTALGRPAVTGDQVSIGSLTLIAQAVSGLAVDSVRVVLEPPVSGGSGSPRPDAGHARPSG
jgi:CBS domain containing-hemolysin-like protein